MNIQKQIQLIRRIKADYQKESARTENEIIRQDLEVTLNGLDAVIATLIKSDQLLDALDILQSFR